MNEINKEKSKGIKIAFRVFSTITIKIKAIIDVLIKMYRIYLLSLIKPPDCLSCEQAPACENSPPLEGNYL